MNLSSINDMIDELEQSETSLSNIRNLSALYTVKNNLLNNTTYNDKTTKELNDILPSYIKYIDIKRKYQMGEAQKESITTYLYSVCSEIREFIQTLYSGTDTQEERTTLKQMVKELHIM